MQSYNSETTYGFFLNCLFNSRIDIGMDSEEAEDNFLNSYLAGVLSSKVRSQVAPAKFSEITEIVKSQKGDRERTGNRLYRLK